MVTISSCLFNAIIFLGGVFHGFVKVGGGWALCRIKYFLGSDSDSWFEVGEVGL